MYDMRILFAALFFLFLLATCWLLARRMWRRNFLLCGPLALAILIGFQAVLLNFLSLFSAVSAFSLLCGNMFFILTVICTEIRRLGTIGVVHEYGDLIKCQADLWSGRSNPLALLVAPLLLMLFCTALVYPPNNWDSMTYHMARVVYWIENGSVAYFPTVIPQQNLMTPGAEYVILLLQLLSASDFLANFVKFISFYLLVSATPSFLRLLGIRRRIANWGLVLAATLPMGVLQATSTQNDMVASCLGLALCAGALRLWHKTVRAKRSRLDIMGLALLCATGYLVKVTAILAALPFLLMAAMCYGIALIHRPQLWQRQAINLLLGMFLVAVVSGPDLYRKREAMGSFADPWKVTFPLNGEWEAKVISSVVGINFHVIPTKAFYESIVKPLIDFFGCRPISQPREPFGNHEDLAGNPLHMIFAGVAILLFLFRFPWIPRPARWGVLLVCVSWILLHATLWYQSWISRLQTPVFMLFPCFLAAWAPCSKVRLVRFSFAAILIVFTMACLCFGIITAARNTSRPLMLTDFWILDRDSAYYNTFSRPRAQHAAVIETVKRLKAKRVGLVIVNGDYDYPLSWRLYRLGIEVRHAIRDLYLECADVVYAPAPSRRPPATKDWPVYGSVLINPRLKNSLPTKATCPPSARSGTQTGALVVPSTPNPIRTLTQTPLHETRRPLGLGRQREGTEWSNFGWSNANETKLPRILLIGDSICNGYQPFVNNELKGIAYMSFYVTSKCVTDRSYIKELTYVLDEYDYAIIHFNNGLHSLDTDRTAWETALREVLKTLIEKGKGARIVWASSTPLKDTALTAKAKELNAIAARVMREKGIPTDDLFALMDPQNRSMWSDMYHYNEAARKMQARQVAESVWKWLPAPAAPQAK